MSELERYKQQLKDRVLGDEWKNWKPSEEGRADVGTGAGRGVFFVFLLLAVFLTIAAAFLALYMVAPRLSMFHPKLVIAFSIVVTLLSVAALFWYLALALTVLTGRTFWPKVTNRRLLTWMIDKIGALGQRFGVSKDRMSNSFIKVFNTVITSQSKPDLPIKPLVILPRCLKAEIREKTKTICESYEIDCFVVGGGQAALEKVRKMKPKAIIGVACERDLIAGIKEVTSDIPVVAIANTRPSGPCKDTEINLADFEGAIRYFLGM